MLFCQQTNNRRSSHNRLGGENNNNNSDNRRFLHIQKKRRPRNGESDGTFVLTHFLSGVKPCCTAWTSTFLSRNTIYTRFAVIKPNIRNVCFLKYCLVIDLAGKVKCVAKGWNIL